MSISEADFAESEDLGKVTVTVVKEGSSSGILAFTLTSFTYDEFFSRGFVLDSDLRSKSLPDPAESKKAGYHCSIYYCSGSSVSFVRRLLPPDIQGQNLPGFRGQICNP